MNNLEPKVLAEIHPFSSIEQSQLNSSSLLRIKPVLYELNEWRKNSLNSNFIFDNYTK